MTNELLINRFLNHLRRDRKSVLTLSAYATDLKQFSAAISPTSITYLTNPKLTTHNQQLLSHFSSNSRARKLTSIREFLHWCYRKGYLALDLSQHIDRPERQTQHPVKPLSQTQIGRLRRHANDLERLVLELLLQTGMRLSEIITIKMKNLNIEKSVLRHPLSAISYPLSGHLFQAITYYLESKKHKASDDLLMNSLGEKLSTRTAHGILALLSRKARVRDVTPRNIRATFIIRQLNAGVSIETLQQATGHKTIAPLARYLAQTKPLPHNRKIELVEI